MPKQKNRLWQENLEPDVIPKDVDDIEAILEHGLPKLLQYFPSSG